MSVETRNMPKKKPWLDAGETFKIWYRKKLQQDFITVLNIAQLVQDCLKNNDSSSRDEYFYDMVANLSEAQNRCGRLLLELGPDDTILAIKINELLVYLLQQASSDNSNPSAKGPEINTILPQVNRMLEENWTYSDEEKKPDPPQNADLLGDSSAPVGVSSAPVGVSSAPVSAPSGDPLDFLTTSPVNKEQPQPTGNAFDPMSDMFSQSTKPNIRGTPENSNNPFEPPANDDPFGAPPPNEDPFGAPPAKLNNPFESAPADITIGTDPAPNAGNDLMAFGRLDIGDSPAKKINVTVQIGVGSAATKQTFPLEPANAKVDTLKGLLAAQTENKQLFFIRDGKRMEQSDVFADGDSVICIVSSQPPAQPVAQFPGFD